MNKNKKKKNHSNNDQFKYIKRLPLLIIIIMIICTTIFVLKNKDIITIENIVSYTPNNMFLASIVLLGIFGLKSLSVVFPLSILYLASGILFPGHIAILVSGLGLLITISIPYFIGSFFGHDLVTSIILKYPKAKQIENYQNNNQFFLCFLTRIVGVLPADILSLYFGACKIPYSVYAVAGVLGSALSFITTTLLGHQLDDPFSKEFLIVLLCRIAVTVGTIFIHRKFKPTAS